jgi:hypothetical protein
MTGTSSFLIYDHSNIGPYFINTLCSQSLHQHKEKKNRNEIHALQLDAPGIYVPQ